MIKLEPFKPSDFDTFISLLDNREILITIAGTYFSYPVTHGQLQKYLDDETSTAFNVLDNDTIIGHAEIIDMGKGLYKLDKVIIDQKIRGKGYGQQLINMLLEYSFEKLNAAIVELNVYDWNAAGIRCYEKTGFTFNPEKKFSTKTGDIEWVALNMTIDKNKWISLQKQTV
jgi:RimJ/RimL family protein N-acetyltransferase